MRKALPGIGLILFVPGGMALLSLPIAWFFEEYYGMEALVITATVSLSLGGLFRYGRSNPRTSFSVAEMMGIATVGWILVTVLGALPFFYLAHRLPADQVTTHQIAPFTSFLNAAFESLSGYTSTGGFSITDQSLNHYAWGPKLVVILMIILGSLNFHSFHQLFTKGAVRRFVNNQQHQLFFALLLIGTLLIFYENNVWANGTASWIDLAFQFSSALGTCGFSTVTVQDWSVPTLLVLTAAMLIGGATASTTGGIKLFRVILLVKGNLYGVLSWMKVPGSELNLRFNHRVFSHDESLRLYRNMGVFSFFWTGMFLLTTIVLLHEVPAQYGLADVLFEAASALGTVGLSVGITNHELSALGKLDLMLAMLVGRLELMPLVIVLAKAMRA